MKVILLFFGLLISRQVVQSQTSYTWNGSLSNAWTNAGNWSPAGIPGAADNVTIVTGGNNCFLVANASINNLTLTSGTLNLNGATLSVNGTTATFSGGTVQNGNLVVTGANTTTFGTGAVTMNCATTISTATISMRNVLFQGTATITKNGSTNDVTVGNNTFNGPAVITNAGAGYFLMGNGNADKFNASVTFNNTGSSSLYPAYNSSGNVFSNVVTVNNSPASTGGVYISTHSAGTQFDDDIIVNSTGGSGVQFCTGNATASATVAAGHSITIGGLGFSAGTLALRQVVQSGNMPVTLSATGTAQIDLGPTSHFGGPVTVQAPNIYTIKSVFDGIVTLTKTDGTNSNASSGGNTFNATLVANYSSSAGTGYWSFANGNRDIYNGDVYANNNSLDRIIFGHASAGNEFNGNFIVTQQGSSAGIALTWNSGASSIMAAGKTISIGSAGFNTGYFYIQGFTQNGNAPVNITAGGNASLYLGAGNSPNHTVLGGPADITAPNIYVTGVTCNSDVVLTKTGGVNNHNNSHQNIFNGDLTINQQSSSGYFMLGYNADDQFNGNIVVNATGSGGINLGWTSGAGKPTLAAGKTISVGGAGFNIGSLLLGGFVQLGTTPVNLTLTGAASFYVVNPGTPCRFEGPLTVTAPDIYIRGGVFDNAASFTKTGGGNDHNNGNRNVFNGPLTINQQSSSYFMLGYNSSDAFNDDITVSSVASGAINLGFNNGTGAPVLAAGKTISIGPAGYSAGMLLLGGFLQLSNTPLTLNLTGTASFYAGISSTPSSFDGPVTVTAPDIFVRGATFNSAASFTKTGGTYNHNEGKQNIFNGPLVINQQSSGGYFMLGYNSNDLFNDDITVTATGSGGINLGYSSGAGTPTLAAGKTIKTGFAGMSSGFLSFYGFTQLGTAPINLSLTGTNTILRFGRNTLIGGNLVATTPDLYFDGATFNGTVEVTKTSGNNNSSAGGNVFNRLCTITNNGAGYILLGNPNPDIWNSDVVFTNNGSERILPAWVSAGNEFNGDIYVNTSGSAQGIYFCGSNPTASATLAAGKTIKTGTGFNAGYLVLRQFTQLGNAPVNLNLAATAAYLQFGPSSAFGGNIVSTSPGLLFNGATFAGTVNSTKTGSSNDASTGNNIFQNTATFINAGTGYLMFGNGNADQFNGAATFNNTGGNNIYVAYNSNNNIFNGLTTLNNTPSGTGLIYVNSYGAGAVFNENIVVNATSGQGISFCSGNTSSSATLAAGKTIAVGSAGFSSGTLLLKQFTQAGGTAQNLALTGTASLVFGPSSAFGGAVTSGSPGLLFNGCSFSSTVNAAKTGTSNDQSTGGNSFHGPVTLTNTGTGYLLLANVTGDTYNANISFVKSNTGLIYPNYNQNCVYAANVQVSASTAITFGANNGTATFAGSSAQNIIAASGTPTPVFTRAVINNSGAGVNLQTPVNISNNLQLIAGLLHTTSANILTMQNNATVAAGNALSTSYVEGPMRYQKASSGATILNFPIGKGADCRPVVLTIAHAGSTSYFYRAELFNASAAALGYSLPPTVSSVSTVHYYTIGRTDASGNNQPTAGLSGNQTIEAHFGENDLITDGGVITIVKNTNATPTAWIDIGGTGGPAYNAGANLTGSITSTSSPTAFNSFSTFAIGFKDITVLPLQALEFTAYANSDYVDLLWTAASASQNSSFTIEKSSDGINFEAVKTVAADVAPGNNNALHLDYSSKDMQPYPGRSYYRLKQIDVAGKITYTKAIAVFFGGKQSVSVYPNPSSGTLYIKGLNAGVTQIEWYDTGGRRVLTQMAAVQNGVTILNTDLPGGAYVLKYAVGKGVSEARLVIIRK